MAKTPQPDTPRSRGDTDAPHISPVTPAEDARTILLNRVSWGAVWLVLRRHRLRSSSSTCSA